MSQPAALDVALKRITRMRCFQSFVIDLYVRNYQSLKLFENSNKRSIERLVLNERV